MNEQLKERLQVWNQRNCMGDKPTLNLNNWLQQVRMLRVLSTFPMLGLLRETKGLELSGSKDYRRGWVSKEPGHLYNLQRSGSPYEVHIADICSTKTPPR